MAENPEPFWSFSRGFYDRPGVAAACVALQDRHGCDVNVVLYACWVGLSGRGPLAAADLAGAEASNGAWRGAVIERLRAARRALREEDRIGPVLELYEAAKTAELAAERIAQRRLQMLAPPEAERGAAERTSDARANLALYLEGRRAEQTAAPIFAAIGRGDGSSADRH
jgi:uncharacterized protein (TIGR02444 family)